MRSGRDQPRFLLALVPLLAVGCQDQVVPAAATVSRPVETAAAGGEAVVRFDPTAGSRGCVRTIWRRQISHVPGAADRKWIGRASRELQREGLRVRFLISGAATFSVAEGSTFDSAAMVTALHKARLYDITLVQVVPGTYVLKCGLG